MGIYNLAWGVALLPLLGALCSFLAETPRRAVQVCVAFSGLALALSAVVLGEWLAHAYASPFQNLISFFGVNPPEGGTFAARFEPFFGVHVDALSASFSFAVAFVTVVIQGYSLTSLRGDTGYRRFGWTSSLLSFATLGLVLSPNLFQSLFMWMAGSAGLYLMTLHWWQRDDAGAPARRIFLALRSSDLALLLATVFVFVKFGIFSAKTPTPAGQDITDPFAFNTIGQSVSAVVHHQLAGSGTKTLAVLSALIIFAVVVRAAQAPFHAWLGEVATAPVAVIAATVSLSGAGAVYLLGRLYPIVITTPHALSALALTSAVSALVVALVCVAQRDLLRVAALSAAVQFGFAFVALAGGGYGEGLFAAFTALLLTTLAVLASGNLLRGYRSRALGDVGVAWQRMRTTSLAVIVWAAAVGGLGLQSYFALTAVFVDRNPAGVPFSAATRLALAALTVAAAAVVAFAAFRLMAQACFGRPAQRRGFRAERVTEVERPLRRWTSLITVGAVAAVLVGLPGVHGVGSGHSRLPALSFLHMVHFGPPAQTGLDGLALLICMGALAGGAAAALVVLSGARRAATDAAVRRLAPLPRVLAQDLYLETTARRLGTPFLLAGRLVDVFDRRVLDTVETSLLQGSATLTWSLGRLRAVRLQRQHAGGIAVIAVIVLLSVLAATGHLGGAHTL